MTRVKEISDKFFSRDVNTKTLTEFANSLIAQENKIVSVNVPVTSAEEYKINGEDVYRFLTDSGNGRVYDGLKSLEVMSRIIRGVGESLETLFDNKIISHSAEDMKTASIEGAVRIVNANLGLDSILAYARSKKSIALDEYDEFVTRIARDVKTGVFKTEAYLPEALLRIKSLIKLILNKG